MQPLSLIGRLIARLRFLRVQELLHKHKIDLAYFSSPTSTALLLTTTPYIFTVWDLGHLDLPGFREVSSFNEWAGRETTLSTAIRRAFHVMVDSDATGQRIEEIYGIPTNRWSSIGLLPSIPEKLPTEPRRVPDSIIYPAARWAHKNHSTLLRAMREVIVQRPELKLILTGSDQGHGQHIADLITELQIEENVVDYGWLPRLEVLALMRDAKLVVMPSLLGPTNLPPLEAILLDTPALVSDIHSFGPEIDGFFRKVPATKASDWATAILEMLGEKQIPRFRPRNNLNAEVSRVFSDAFFMLKQI